MQRHIHILQNQDCTFGKAEKWILLHFESIDNKCVYLYQNRSDFTGKEKDVETGYGYFGARYMDHELMTMWLSVDPMADKYPSISPYAYCAWNPVKLLDPNGNEVMENDDEWKYNITSGLLSHVSDKGGKDQQTVYCVSNIGNHEVLNETVSFNGQIEDMFDFSVINDSWDQIIYGSIQAVGGLVTAIGGVAVGVSTFGFAIPMGAGIVGYGGYQLGTGLETVAEGIWGGTSENKYERQEVIKTICSWATDCGLAGIVAKNTDVALKRGISKVGRIAKGIATLGVESAWSISQITNTLLPERRSQLPKGAIVTRPNANSRPRVGVGLIPY